MFALPTVFVHDSLRPGHEHHSLLMDSVFTAHPAKVDGFALHTAADGAAFAVPSAGSVVYGDLLAFAPSSLPSSLLLLDTFHGFNTHPSRYDLCRHLRRTATAHLLADDATYAAHIYIVGPSTDRAELIRVATGDISPTPVAQLATA